MQEIIPMPPKILLKLLSIYPTEVKYVTKSGVILLSITQQHKRHLGSMQLAFNQ